MSSNIMKHGLIEKIKRDKYLLILMLPAVLYFVVFRYIPVYGLVISFENYFPGRGFFSSPWVGFKWFEEFFGSMFFFRLIRNTVLLSLYNLIWSFPVPIIFALLLNEVKNKIFKRTVQTISYMPYFISVVVVVGLMANILSVNEGIVNVVIKSLGGKPIAFFNESGWFRTLYISSGVWQSFGFSAIIYISALTAIDVQLYEASKIDGASRWKQMIHITLPGILPTIVILFILSIGNLLSVGFEKVILMYNPSTYETSDIIATYVYRKGILGAQYSFGAAVSLFNSVINFILVITFNNISKRYTEYGLW